MNRFRHLFVLFVLSTALKCSGSAPALADSTAGPNAVDSQAQTTTGAGQTGSQSAQAGEAAAAKKEEQHPTESGPPNNQETPGWHAGKGSAVWRAAPGSELKQIDSDTIEIERGEVVIEPNHTITVTTPLAKTQILHKSAVLFRVKRGSERCMVLWDNGPDSVTVVCHQHKLKLGPGKEVLITDHDPNYREITESDDIGRRRIKMHQVGSHQHIVTAEFYLLHALQRDPLLYDVAHSKDRRDQALREHILKTAAVLNMVTHGHGFYATNSGY